MPNLRTHVQNEITAAETAAEPSAAFRHLERAHVLGQADTRDHTRVHWRMLKLAVKMRDPKEIWGQIVRVVGAATKTPLGIYPAGNTGGSDVWFFKPMPVPDDLRAILDRSDPKR